MWHLHQLHAAAPEGEHWCNCCIVSGALAQASSSKVVRAHFSCELISVSRDVTPLQLLKMAREGHRRVAAAQVRHTMRLPGLTGVRTLDRYARH